MNARQKFIRWVEQAPIETQRSIVHLYWTNKPYSLSAILLEVKMDTALGKEILKDLGWEEKR